MYYWGIYKTKHIYLQKKKKKLNKDWNWKLWNITELDYASTVEFQENN